MPSRLESSTQFFASTTTTGPAPSGTPNSVRKYSRLGPAPRAAAAEPSAPTSARTVAPGGSGRFQIVDGAGMFSTETFSPSASRSATRDRSDGARTWLTCWSVRQCSGGTARARYVSFFSPWRTTLRSARSWYGAYQTTERTANASLSCT